MGEMQNRSSRGSSRSHVKDISAGLGQSALCHELVVGNGKRVSFWELLGGHPSKVLFQGYSSQLNG